MDHSTDRDAKARALIQEGQALLAQGHADAARGPFEAATDVLYGEYQRYLYVLCLSRLRDPQQAEEMCHEVLSAAYFAMPTFRHESSLKTWLSGICHRKILKSRRDWSRRIALLEAQQQVIHDEAHASGDLNPNQELVDRLRDYGVYTLSQRDQTLFIKRYIEGYALSELTTRWTSEAAVRKRLAKIIQTLQRHDEHESR